MALTLYKGRSPEVRAAIRTGQWIVLPAFGTAMWVIFCQWLVGLAHADQALAAPLTVFGIPTMIGITIGVRMLYKMMLKQEIRKDRGY